MKARVRQLAWLVSRHPDLVCVLVLLALAGAFIAANLDDRPSTNLDCLGYFRYLPPLFAGQPFQREPPHNPVSQAPFWEQAYQGWVKSGALHVFGIGPALAWLPWYGVAWLAAPHQTGYEPAFWMACAWGTVAAALAGLVLLYLALRALTGPWPALAASGAALFCTPLLFYVSAAPFTSHHLSFALVSLLLWLVLTRDRQRGGTWLAAGLACGLLGDTRPQALLYALLPLVVLRPGWRQAATFAGGLAAAFAPQMLYWRAIFGSWLVLPQSEAIPGFFRVPAVGAVLFSPLHGLFSWHPLLLAGVGGLVALLVRAGRRRLAAAALLIFGLQVLVNGMPMDWWGGWSFGGRRFCDTLPLLALGLGVLLRRLPAMGTLAAAAAAWWNLGLFWAYDRAMRIDEPLSLAVVGEIWRHQRLAAGAAWQGLVGQAYQALPFLVPLLALPAAALALLAMLRTMRRLAGSK